MNPLVSVVINNYNYGRFLKQAVETALAQTYENVEVIVVDDGSTDSSREILRGFMAKVKVIEKANGGQASAFNIGIKAASGDYILLLDSDDLLFPQAVEECVALFPAGYSRIYFRLRLVDAEGNSLEDVDIDPYFRSFDGNFFARAAAGVAPFWPPTSANFFRADALRSVLPVPESEFRICADAFVNVRSALCGPVRSIEKELGSYRIHGTNNFVSVGQQYSNESKLKTKIENVYRIRNLLESTFELAGVPYRASRDEEDYGLVKALCFGFRLGLDSAPLKMHSIRTLGGLVVRHVRLDKSSGTIRFVRLLYLSSLLALPLPVARKLIQVRDR